MQSYQSNQQVFDLVVEHLSKMPSRSVRIEDAETLDLNVNGLPCYYRGDSNNKCAIGCLIPDELYDPKMDNVYDNETDISSIISEFSSVLCLFKNIDIEMLSHFQLAHDKSNNWDASGFTNISDLLNIAKQFKLETLAIDYWFDREERHG